MPLRFPTWQHPFGQMFENLKNIQIQNVENAISTDHFKSDRIWSFCIAMIP
jgi:hypothetical protein